MRGRRGLGIVAVVGWAVGGAACAGAPPRSEPAATEEKPAPAVPAPGEDRELARLRELAIRAYVYGYPLVTFDTARRLHTNVAEPGVRFAPPGEFAHERQLPKRQDPGSLGDDPDSLASSAFVDLSAGPWLLRLPSLDQRYYSFAFLDAWTEVIGLAESGQKRGERLIALVGPGYSGALPAGAERHEARGHQIWILGHLAAVDTAADLSAVSRLQDKVRLTPLAAEGKAWKAERPAPNPALNPNTPVREQVNALGVEEFFRSLNQLMAENPPAPADAPLLEELRELGVGPGLDFRLDALGTERAGALGDVPKLAQARIIDRASAPRAPVNGWIFATADIGNYGTQYLGRAAMAVTGLGASPPRAAVFATLSEDAIGQPLRGNRTYVLRFEKDQWPPASGPWSLTSYDGAFLFFDAVVSRSPFRRTADGALEIYLSKSAPAGHEDNWLEIPEGPFQLALRLYQPRPGAPSILDGSWQPPMVRQGK